MKLSVLHRTAFLYGGPVTDSTNELHLEPRTFPFQKTISSLIRVLPATRLSKFKDLFQNTTHHFEIPGSHTRLEIESHIRVHNLPLDIPDEARNATKDAYRSPAVRDRSWPYLNESARVVFRPEIWRQAIDITFGHESYFDKATEIMRWINAEFRYEPGTTDVATHLDQCFAERRGVCQDFTHVMLGLCRSAGIPARYASGYLYNGPRDHLIGAQASHAWAEVFLPVVGWIGFDPTNNNLADARYVKIAVGRDYEDIAPIRGTYRGAAHCQMEVEVLVEQIP